MIRHKSVRTDNCTKNKKKMRTQAAPIQELTNLFDFYQTIIDINHNDSLTPETNKKSILWVYSKYNFIPQKCDSKFQELANNFPEVKFFKIDISNLHFKEMIRREQYFKDFRDDCLGFYFDGRLVDVIGNGRYEMFMGKVRHYLMRLSVKQV